MSTSSLFSRQLVWVGMAVLLFNLVWKGMFLGSQPIAGDEPFSIFVAHNLSMVHIVRYLSTGNNPPLWELMLHGWTHLFGIGAVSVRFLPLVFSSVTALLLFRLGARHFDWQTGLLAALFVTFTDYHIHFAHEARSYALFGMLTCASMALFLRLMTDKASSRWILAGLALTNTAIIYTHFFGFWVLSIQAVIGAAQLWGKEGSERRLSWVWGVVLPVIGYLPYLPVLLDRWTESASSGTWVARPNGIFSLVDMLRTFTNERYGTSNFYGSKPLLTVLVIAAALWGHTRYLRANLQKVSTVHVAVIVWFLLPFVLMWLLSFRVPMFHDRYLIFVSVAFALVVAVGLRSLIPGNRSSALVMVVAATLLMLTGNPDVSNGRDLRSVVAQVKAWQSEHPGVAVVICPEWFDLGFLYHYDRECFASPTTVSEFYSYSECLRSRNVVAVRGAEALATSGVDMTSGVILVDADAQFAYPENGLIAYLNDRFETVEQAEFPEIFTLTRFRPKSGQMD